jgi:hypothetical protein
MRLNLAGALLAGRVWLLATVLAWPAGYPAAAVALLAAQAGLYAVIAVRDTATGATTLNVRPRRRRSP